MKYSKEFKINALRTYKESGMNPTEFAMKYNIPDSTFFDWLKKYNANECYLEITSKVENLQDQDVFYVEGPKSLAFSSKNLHYIITR